MGILFLAEDTKFPVDSMGRSENYKKRQRPAAIDSHAFVLEARTHAPFDDRESRKTHSRECE